MRSVFWLLAGVSGLALGMMFAVSGENKHKN
jgi:hypothetical protein